MSEAPKWCEKLGKASLGYNVNLERYADLPPVGQRLIKGWWARETLGEDTVFESFIYTWVAFNAWAECVSGLERDRDWITAISANIDVRGKAEEAMAEQKVQELCSAFHRNWPLFKLRELQAKQVATRNEPDRCKLVNIYLEAGAKPAAPECWESHNKGRECPLDWPHMLNAIYRVRNNLFHGAKFVDSEMDRSLVNAAVKALRAVVEQAKLIAE